MIRGVLYISYDGVFEPLGQSQVLAYLERLAVDQPIHLISFEKSIDLANVVAVSNMKQFMLDVGVFWYPRRYHKSPTLFATAWDIFVGIMTGIELVWKYRLSIVHARSYVASVMALAIKRITNVKFIFDMRGFWADERVDGGIWKPHSLLYKVAKNFERYFLLNADYVISLTYAAIREIKSFNYLNNKMPPFKVIPTCANLERFHPPVRQTNNYSKENFTLGYVGTVGAWYMFDMVATCFNILLKFHPKAKLLIINRGEHDFIRHTLESAGITVNSFEICSVEYSDVPKYLAGMDAGIFFIKPVFSKKASTPTKLAEFLGCGIPCLTNTGIGDMAELFNSEKIGIAVNDFDLETLKTGIEFLLSLCADPETQMRCIAVAQKHFSLDKGVNSYREVYQELFR